MVGALVLPRGRTASGLSAPVAAAALSAGLYWLLGMTWWMGAIAGFVGSLGVQAIQRARRKPLRADPHRIAQLEYELGFTDKKPEPLVTDAPGAIRYRRPATFASADQLLKAAYREASYYPPVMTYEEAKRQALRRLTSP